MYSMTIRKIRKKRRQHLIILAKLKNLGYLTELAQWKRRYGFDSEWERRYGFDPKWKRRYGPKWKRGYHLGKKSKKKRFHIGKYSQRFAIKSLVDIWIPIEQIESAKRAILRYLSGRAKLRVFPNPKPDLIRLMEWEWEWEWVYVIKPGQRLYEMSGVSKTIARRAIALATYRIYSYRISKELKFVNIRYRI